MRRAAENIRARRYEIAAVMSIEVGKNRIESLGDAEEAADLIDYYATKSKALTATRVRWISSRPTSRRKTRCDRTAYSQ